MENIENLKVPVLKRDAKVTIELDYNECGAIAQTLFCLASTWDKDKIDEFQKIVSEKGKLTDISMICYVYMEKVYRNILEKAKSEDNVDYTDFTNCINPLLQNS